MAALFSAQWKRMDDPAEPLQYHGYLPVDMDNSLPLSDQTIRVDNAPCALATIARFSAEPILLSPAGANRRVISVDRGLIGSVLDPYTSTESRRVEKTSCRRTRTTALPGVMYVHGASGFLAIQRPMIALCVRLPLARSPEARYPVAIEQADAAIGVDPSHPVVLGDSVGALWSRSRPSVTR